MDDLLFADDVDLGQAPDAAASGCTRPIGRRGRPWRRPSWRPPRVTSRSLLREVRAALDRQQVMLLALTETIGGLARRQQRDQENAAALLPHAVEIRRALGATELHQVDRRTRRRPLG